MDYIKFLQKSPGSQGSPATHWSYSAGWALAVRAAVRRAASWLEPGGRRRSCPGRRDGMAIFGAKMGESGDFWKGNMEKGTS